MSSELEIPQRAIVAACRAYDAALGREAEIDPQFHVEDYHVRRCAPIIPGVDEDHAEIQAVRVAAPIIVAVELRLAAQKIEARMSDASDELPEEALDVLICEAGHLRDRADELDPR